MIKVKFLDELLNEKEIVERFGLKTEGLVKLKNILEPPELPTPASYVTIPDFFAVAIDQSAALDSAELRQAYNKLTSGLKDLKIILARSSDPEEEPGKFATASSLYIPGSHEQSYKS
jgi:hypothetical protein